MAFSKLEKQLNIKFSDKDLLQNAFVHRSYLNEHPDFHLPSNERLEFLGDACLELIVSDYLYDQYPEESEGVLTNFRSALVNTESLAETARKLKLGSYLLLSKGEEDGGGRDSDHLLANTFEALLGACYLEHGYPYVKNLVEKHLLFKLPDIIAAQAFKDPKSKFQELTQEVLKLTPQYRVLKDWGPDHSKCFQVAVYVGSKMWGVGEGNSKQQAELEAAQDALCEWDKKWSKYA